MLLIARKNLFSERIRLAISVGGVALSVFLIGILLSLYRGWDEKVGEYVEMVPADLWVAAEGTTDFIQAASVLPAGVGGHHLDVLVFPQAEATARPAAMRMSTRSFRIAITTKGYGALQPPVKRARYSAEQSPSNREASAPLQAQ